MAATRDKVFEACETLIRGGHRPTIEAIRLHLGGGSFSTIGKYRKEWLAQLPADEAIAVNVEDMPADVRGDAHKLFDDVLSKVWHSASDALQTQRLATLEAENERYQEALKELDGLRAACKFQTEQITLLSGQLALAKAGVGLDEAESFLAVQKAKDQAIANLQTAQSQIQELTQQLADQSAQLSALQNTVATAETELHRLGEENHQLKIASAEIERLQERLKEKDAAIANLQKQIPTKGLTPIEVDGPDASALAAENLNLKVQVQALQAELEEQRQQAYLATLATEEPAPTSKCSKR